MDVHVRRNLLKSTDVDVHRTFAAISFPDLKELDQTGDGLSSEHVTDNPLVNENCGSIARSRKGCEFFA
jgi:hypothetical protein